jgi:drug/metabolite transporter (DMT)-like permease
MSAVLLALVAGMFYGTADFLGGLATRRAGALATSVVSQTTGLLVIVTLAWLAGYVSIARADLLWGVAAGCTGILGLLLLYRGLADGPMSVVAPTTALCALGLPVVVGLSLGERLAPLAVSGVALAAAAVVLISLPPPSASHADRVHLLRAFGLSVAAGVLIAAFLVCFERTSADAGYWPLVVARVSSMVTVAVVIALRGRERFTMPGDRRWFLLPIVSGAIDNVANALYTTAVRADLLSIIAPVASLYPAATLLLARLVLGERVTRLQGMGLGLAAAAVVLLTGR